MGEDKGTFMSPLRSQEQQVCRRIKKKEKQNFWNKNKIKASSGVGWPAGATLPSPPPPKLRISPTGIYWSPQLILKKNIRIFSFWPSQHVLLLRFFAFQACIPLSVFLYVTSLCSAWARKSHISFLQHSDKKCAS